MAEHSLRGPGKDGKDNHGKERDNAADRRAVPGINPAKIRNRCQNTVERIILNTFLCDFLRFRAEKHSDQQANIQKNGCPEKDPDCPADKHQNTAAILNVLLDLIYIFLRLFLHCFFAFLALPDTPMQRQKTAPDDQEDPGSCPSIAPYPS